MTRKFPAATKLAVLLAAAALVAVGFDSPAERADQASNTIATAVPIQADGPNRSYQQGPRTRVYVTTRSWLDAGTEVLPGDRKFQDYAFPSPYRVPIVRARKPQPADRSPAAQPAVGFGRISDGIPAVLSKAHSPVTKMPGFDDRAFCLLSMRYGAYACSVCNSFKIASPICVVRRWWCLRT